MGFISRKGISYNSLFYVMCFLWLCGSDRVPSGFKIYRSERDIFTNLNCTAGEVCTKSQCKMYGAECVNENNCDHCRCWEGRNTFLISNNDQGKCKRDEDIEPKSVPEEAFQLENTLYTKCLKLDSSNNYILATSCVASRTLDMLWIWTATGKKQQLINVKTFKCMENKNDGKNVIMNQCANKNKQTLECIVKVNRTEIRWSQKVFLHLIQKQNYKYAISKKNPNTPQQWSSKETRCKTSTAYKGCYRFSDGSFMKYLDYNLSKPTLSISAPIFRHTNSDCKLSETFNFFRDNHTGVSETGNIFSLRKLRGNTVLEVKFSTTQHFKAWNGSLLKLSVHCRNEAHCVLLKLKSLPTYSDVINTTLPPFPSVTSTEEVITTFPSETTTEYDDTSTPSPSRKPTTEEAATLISTTSEYDKESTTPITTYSWSSEVVSRTSQSTKGDNEGETPSEVSPTSITSTTENPQEGLKEEASESGGGNSVAIAVTVTLLLVALALALGFLFYCRRRKRAQVPQNNNRDTGVVNYSKEIYEDPDRIYETLKENENGVPCNQPGINFDTYTYPDNIMLNPTPSEQEYSYAKNTDFPRSSVGTKPEAKRPINNGVVYETLEQPGKPRDDDFYNYPDNTSIAKPPSSELEYTYAKDTDFPRCNPNTKLPASQDPEKNAVYETLEQPGQPADDDFYSYPENTNIAKPPSSELEYSYAKNTDIPTLDEQSPPQPPVYSTLEGPDDGDNKQVTEERPCSNDHTYIDVIHDSNN